jgi:hypothetical protein
MPGSLARTLVTWVVLIASRDGFFNPLKPNSQDYTIHDHACLFRKADKGFVSDHGFCFGEKGLES